MAIALLEGREVRGVEAIAERPGWIAVSRSRRTRPSCATRTGRLVGAVNVLVDISDRKRGRGRGPATAEALARLERREGRVPGPRVARAADAGHDDLRQRAAAARPRRAARRATATAMVADIAGESERLLGVVENLLLLTRLESGIQPDPEPQVLAHVTRLVVDSFHGGIRTGAIALDERAAAPHRRGRPAIPRADHREPAQQRRQVQPDRTRRSRSSSGRPRPRPTCSCSIAGSGSTAPIRDVCSRRSTGPKPRAAGLRPGHRAGRVPARHREPRRPDLGQAARRAAAPSSGSPCRSPRAPGRRGVTLRLAPDAGLALPGASAFPALAWASWICLKTLPMPGRMRSRAAASAS